MKKWFNIQTLLVALICIYQFAVPMGRVMASETLLPPSNLAYQTITPDDGKLTWSAVFGATGYKVYEIKDGQLVVLGSTTATSYSLNNLPEGSYRYVVSTLSSDGESGPSAPVSADVVYPNMQAPGSLTSSIKNGNDIVLSWGKSQYAEGYKVYQVSETGEKTLVTSTTGTTYTKVNAAEGSYTYTVTAYNSLYGESPDADPVKVDVAFPEMMAPANPSFTITNGTDVNLKWQASAYATGYKLYEEVDGQLQLMKTVSTTSATLSNVAAGDHTYKVFSYSDRFGDSATGSDISVTVSSIVMAAPSNLTYKIQNTNDAVLSWGAVPYADGYKIYQITNGEATLKSPVTGTSVTYSMLPGGDYEYEVHSYSNRYGESEAGSKVSFSIDTVKMYPPTDFSYQIQNGNDIVLKWNTSDNATNYKIYQIVDGQKVLKSTVTGTTVTYTNMPAGNYQYEVHAYSTRFGESDEGIQLSFTLDPISLKAPANADYVIKNGNDVTFSWDSVEYATNYKVYQIMDGKKVLKATVSSATATLTNLVEGDAVYEIHSYSSRFGESAEGTTVNVSIVYPKMAPPANVNQTTVNPTSFTLSWSAVDYATSYKVYQIVDGQKVLKSTVTGTSVTYSNMLPGTYNYVIDSYSPRFGESQYGTSIQVTVNGQALPAPANLTYSITNGNDVFIKWDAVQYATSYKIYQVINGEEVLQRTVTSTSTTFSNMPEGNFDFVVKADSTLFGESPNRAEVTGSVIFPVMQKPQNLTSSVANGNDITLRWNPVTYANKYKIYQIVDGEKVLKNTVTGTAITFSNTPEADYHYEVYSYSDRFGESPEGSPIEVDLTLPNMQAPANFTKTIVNGNDIALRWNAASYATAYKIYQIIDGEKVLQKTVTSASYTFQNMPEGDYQYEIHSYSDRFGESSEGSQLEFNLTWPIMQAPANLTKTLANGNDIVLKWNAATYATGYKVYQIINGEKVLKNTVTSASVTFTNMPEGDYQYEVHSYSSRFGESPEGSSNEFNLTWPVVQAPVVSGSVFNANNITLTWKSVAWANEYRVYELDGSDKKLLYKGPALSYKIYNLTEDTHTFVVTAYSTRFGESAPSEPYEQKIVYPVMEAPTVSIKLLSDTSARLSWDFVTYANGYNVYEIIDGKPVLLVKNLNNLSYDVQNLSYANHEYYVTSYSNSFGESKPSETVIAKLITDTQAPVTKSNVPAEWVNQDQLITLTATDDESGVASTFYSLNDGTIQEGTSMQVGQEGVNKISFNSVDKAGNVEQVKTEFVKIDKTAPTTTINDIPEYSQSVTVNLSGKDELSGVAKTYYSINGAEFSEGTSFVVDKEGTNKISYYSVDAAGNKEEVKTKEINIDRTAPVTTSDVPDTWVNKDVTVTLNATDENSGVANTYYSINGSDYTEGNSFVMDTEGINEISYYSVDKAGNKEEAKTVEVKVDKTAPVTTTDAPNTWVNKDVTVSLTADDKDSGVAKTYYSVNGSDYAEGNSFVVDKEGINKISYYSVDAAGNKEEVKTVEVKVDKTAPTTSSDAAETWANKDVTVTLAAEDENSGVSKTYYSVNGSDYAEGSSFVVDKEGINEISYYSMDAAGNKEEAKTVQVKIDKTAPTVSVDLNKEYELGSTLTLDYQADDNLSGIASEEVTFDGKSYKKGDQITFDQPGDYQLSIKVTDAAGLSTVVQRSITVYIPVSLEVTPKVIKVNTGVFTVRATLPAKYQSAKFDISSARLNGVSAVTDTKGLQTQAEKGQFKFNREDFLWSTGEVSLEFRGYLDNKFLVIGRTTVEAKK